MYTFKPFFDDRYYIIKTSGVFSPQECKEFVQDMLDFSARIGFKRFGSVHDMTENAQISEETRNILTPGMELSLLVGFTVVGRIFHTITDDIIASIRKSNISAGFLANYFLDEIRSIEFVRKILGQYPDTPVIERSEVEKLLDSRFHGYSINLNRWK